LRHWNRLDGYGRGNVFLVWPEEGTDPLEKRIGDILDLRRAFGSDQTGQGIAQEGEEENSNGDRAESADRVATHQGEEAKEDKQDPTNEEDLIAPFFKPGGEGRSNAEDDDDESRPERPAGVSAADFAT